MKPFALLLALLLLQGCTTLVVGTAVGAATTVAAVTVKAPFKVAGAAVDAVTDDEDD